MKHLLDINELSKEIITNWIQRAFYFKNNSILPCYNHHSLATLFYENSTRTRISFELAAKKLGITVVNVDLLQSSERKGESTKDTLNTLAAMGIDLFVIRHSSDNFLHTLPSEMKQGHLINAGDGQHAHPTQALLDAMTILEQKPNISQLKIAIVGDIRHSRVANSLQCLFEKFGVNHLVLVAPELWQPTHAAFGHVTHKLKEGIENADVIICLRVQQERLMSNEHLDLATYHDQYAITSKNISWAKPDAIIMHPGPVNHGIEIDSDVANGKQSFILQQVTNGVWMRMAVLEALITENQRI